MKVKKIEILVLNSGCQDVPPDMLRYDGAFASELFQEAIAFVTFQTKLGNLYGQITYDRWRSFGCQFDRMDIQAERDHKEHMMDRPDKWYTFRSFHRGNIHQMVRFTFEEYVEAKDVRQLEDETERRALKMEENGGLYQATEREAG